VKGFIVFIIVFFDLLSLLDSSLGGHPVGDTVIELLESVSRENVHNLWHAAQKRYPHAHPQHHPTLGHPHPHHGQAYSGRSQGAVSNGGSLFFIRGKFGAY
jgi:hypothetical protein